MKAAVVFWIFILIIFLLIIIPSLIYVKIYQGKINKRMNHINEKNRKHMIEPFRFCIIWSAAVVILSIFFITIINDSGNSNTSESTATYDFKIFEGEEINDSYIGNFSTEENTGYIKVEKEVENFRVTAFYSEEAYDGIHPNFIAYVQYTGSEEYMAQDVHGGFYGYDGNILSGKGYAGGDGEKIICFAGYVHETAKYSEYFEGHVYYMDEKNMELTKEKDDEGGRYINTGCRFTLDFNNESIDIQIVDDMTV